MMNCEWRHYLHVRLPSAGYDRWRGDPKAKPDQLTQWATTAPTGEEIASMAKLGHSHGAVKTRTTLSPVQRWMVDSGCGNDLIDQLSAENLPKIEPPRPWSLKRPMATSEGEPSAPSSWRGSTRRSPLTFWNALRMCCLLGGDAWTKVSPSTGMRT